MLELDFFAQHEGWEFSGEASQRYYNNYTNGGMAPTCKESRHLAINGSQSRG